jgi:hypothetical protein
MVEAVGRGWHGHAALKRMKIRKWEVVARVGIEPATRGFSVPNRWMQLKLHQQVGWGGRCLICHTMQDRARLIPARLARSFVGNRVCDLRIHRCSAVQRRPMRRRRN